MVEENLLKIHTLTEVSKELNVSSQTLRDWEKELQGIISIPRNSQGHRYYTTYELDAFRRVNELRAKNVGFEMIRNLMTAAMERGVSNLAESEVAVTVDPLERKAQSDAVSILQNLETFVKDFEASYKETITNQIVLELKEEMNVQFTERLDKALNNSEAITETNKLNQELLKENQLKESRIIELEKELAVYRDREQNKGFFSKIFSSK